MLPLTSLSLAALLLPLQSGPAAQGSGSGALSNTAGSAGHLSRRGFASAAALLFAAPQGANARPEGVNKPELLPREQVNVIDLENFLTSGQRARIDTQLASLEKATGVKLRLLCQAYPNTPGLAIKDYWRLDDKSIVMVVDKGAKGASNILNFNVGEGLKLQLPNLFWSRLQSTFGTTFFVRDNGEDVAITRAIDTIDYCLRNDFCTDVPDMFKNPSKAMYGEADAATQELFGAASKGVLDGLSAGAASIFGN